MKTLLKTLGLIIGLSGLSQAFTSTPVIISTNTLQYGTTVYVSSETVGGVFVATGPVTLGGKTSLVTVVSSITFSCSSCGIQGVTDGGIANTGMVGEVVWSSSAFTTQNTQAVDFSCSTMTLTAGSWLLMATCDWSSNGATWTRGDCGISQTDGNSAAGMTAGYNLHQLTWGSSSVVPTAIEEVVVGYVQNITATTKEYVKMLSNFSAGNPQFACTIAAQRIR